MSSAEQKEARTSYARRGESPQDFLITKCVESCTEKKEGKLDEWYGSDVRRKVLSI